MFSLRDVFFAIVFLYVLIVAFLSIKLVVRAQIFDSFQDFKHQLVHDRRKLLNLKWRASSFPIIDPNDKMLRFVIQAQKRLPYMLVFSFVIISLLSDDKVIF
ncbi:hypothetical protein GCM10009129_17080 [Psychrobacter aestuarii]|uniref:Uncharacterized protein n=1 Tax=Psychrobacter aestuarii TaxID=556327 RepID=A0ABP3FM58_9GAMM